MSGWLKSAAAARKVLIITWFGFFIFNLAIIFFLYLGKWIAKDNFKAALQQLNTCYAPYIGAITLFYWASARKKSQRTGGQVGTAFTLAWICSLLWNGMLLVFLLPLLFQSGTVEESIENIRDFSPIFSWLVAGAIGFYFANPTSASE